MFCPNCGCGLYDGAKFCSRCGANLTAFNLSAARPVAPADPSLYYEVKRISFGTALKSFFRNYTNFTGRATRREFWFPMLFVMIIRFITVIVIAAAAFIAAFTSPELVQAAQSGDLESVVADMPGWLTVVGSLSSAVLLFFLLPTATALVRRLHDTGRSGLYALGVFIPFFLVIISSLAEFIGFFGILIPILSLAALAYFTVLIVFASQDSAGDNKYGPRRVDPARPKVIYPPALVSYIPEDVPAAPETPAEAEKPADAGENR